jgi:hypothetical protein
MWGLLQSELIVGGCLSGVQTLHLDSRPRVYYNVLGNNCQEFLIKLWRSVPKTVNSPLDRVARAAIADNHDFPAWFDLRHPMGMTASEGWDLVLREIFLLPIQLWFCIIRSCLL